MEPPENEPFNETMSFRELSLSSLHLESSLKVTPEALRSIVKGLLDRPWQDRQHLLSFSLKVDQDTFAEVSYDLFDLKQRYAACCLETKSIQTHSDSATTLHCKN